MTRQDKDFDELSLFYGQMGIKTESLVRYLLASNDIRVLDVVHRVKSETSARRKMESKSGSYADVSDLHDILGMRIITYLESDVTEVVRILRDNFEVDESRSLDKQSHLDPDRFGYLSHHLVVTVHPSRSGLPEWSAFKEKYFEIQVRSILQHAWAEIEHDLGYKSASGIPAHIRRRFARLAGLLELADSEFDGLSTEVAQHVSTVTTLVAVGGNLPIDRDSIRAVATTEGAVAVADRRIAEAIGATLADAPEMGYADLRASELLEVGYSTVNEVRNAMETHLESIVRFASDWFNRPLSRQAEIEREFEDTDSDGRYVKLTPGVSLFYLYLHHLLANQDGEPVFTSMVGMEYDEEQEAFRRIHDAAFGISATGDSPPPAAQ